MTDSPGRPQLEYRRIADALAARIESGEFAAGSRLPPEQALAEDFGVAYGTVRRAMDVLRERGLIMTVWGKGTFVREE
jgi:GntR family transcriptional regulator